VEAESHAGQAVVSFIQALNDEEFETARQCRSDELSCVGALGSRIGNDVYIHDMRRMRIQYDVKKVFVDGPDVCVCYEFTLSALTVVGGGWYHVDGGRIRTIRVLYSRPMLDATKH
jgi:hypothetical protein